MCVCVCVCVCWRVNIIISVPIISTCIHEIRSLELKSVLQNLREHIIE
jgi:hypothetical protein